MNEITLATLDHLVLRAKQIKEIIEDFVSMYEYGVHVCTLSGDCIDGTAELHVTASTLVPLSILANQKISIEPMRSNIYLQKGSFTYKDVKFYALFDREEVEAYHAENP